MENQPDLTFYFAIHEHQRQDLARYQAAVTGLTEADRVRRGKALARWAKGFRCQLDEHHSTEDRFFFPSLRAKVDSAGAVLDGLESDHRHLDELLARWPDVAAALADTGRPFAMAHADAVAFATELRDFLTGHLAIEDQDVLPLFWRHYTAEEYDTLQGTAVKKAKKAGMSFVAPWTVDTIPPAEQEAFLASVPGILRLIHRLTEPRYDRMCAVAFGEAAVTPSR